MRVRYRARALADIDDIFRFLDERSPSGARNVLRGIREAIDELAEHPLAAPRTSDPEIRVKILARYRYKIFYSVAAAEYVEIIHVRHAARRPWRS
jgi:plasmid stabilization system protein ParE